MIVKITKNVFNKVAFFSLVVLGLSCTNEDTLVDTEEFLEVNENKEAALVTSSKTTNLALGKTTQQSSTAYGGVSSSAVDGNTSGIWNQGSVTHTSNAFQPWWQVYLDSDTNINEIKIWNRTNCCSDRLSNFDVFIYDSNNNRVFKTTITSTPSPSVTINTGGVVGNRVRIKLKGTNPLSLAEVQVFGGEASNEEEAAISRANVSIDFDNLEVETSWISKDKGDRDTFVASGVDGESWMDVLSSGVVIMKCLAGDGHRTELKEAPGTEASLNKTREMSYTATLTDVPEHGVTIAQIHNRGGVKRPWIRVYVHSDNTIRIKTTETTPGEDESTYETYIGPEYNEGDEFSVIVKTGNGVADIEIITNGNSLREQLIPTDDWDDYSNDYYLKAGVYTEGDDVEPEMRMSSFSIEH